MNCVEWEERIALHAGGDLGGDEAAEVERHLAGCEACREFQEELKASLGLLQQAHAEEIAPAHYAAVRARVWAESGKRRAAWRCLWAGAAAAAAVVVLAAVSLWPRAVPPPQVAWHRPPVVAPAPIEVCHEAAQARRPVRHRRPVSVVARRPVQSPAAPRQPLVVKLFTDDPNVVIYWIADEGDD